MSHSFIWRRDPTNQNQIDEELLPSSSRSRGSYQSNLIDLTPPHMEILHSYQIHHLLINPNSKCDNHCCDCNIEQLERREPRSVLSIEAKNHLEFFDNYFNMICAYRPLPSHYGTIQFNANNRIRIDVTLDGAIRVQDLKNKITIAISSDGISSAVIHPKCRMYQIGKVINIYSFDSNNLKRHVKIYYKGVAFKTEPFREIYLLNRDGISQIEESFRNMNDNYCGNVFYSDSRIGCQYINDAWQAIKYSAMSNHEYGNVLDICNVSVLTTKKTAVRISREEKKYNISMHSNDGTIKLQTPLIHITVSPDTIHSSNLYISNGERSIQMSNSIMNIYNQSIFAICYPDNSIKFIKT